MQLLPEPVLELLRVVQGVVKEAERSEKCGLVASVRRLMERRRGRRDETGCDRDRRGGRACTKRVGRWRDDLWKGEIGRRGVVSGVVIALQREATGRGGDLARDRPSPG